MSDQPWVDRLYKSADYSFKQTPGASPESSRPIVVVDVDLTLFDNQERTRAILHDYVQSRSMLLSEKSEMLARLRHLPIEFSITENLAALGIVADEVRTAARQFWYPRFFSDRYLHYDIPYVGAAQALHALIQRGALIAYVTGRIAATMAVGTVREFLHHGFPIATADTMLILKPDHAEDDTEFKVRTLHALFGIGQPICLVDNEPRICNAWFDVMSSRPSAQDGLAWVVIHRATRHSPGAPTLLPGIVELSTWLPLTGEHRRDE